MLGFFESGKGNSVKKFECFHPVSAGFFFLSMLLITVFSSFPLIQIFSLAGGIAFDITLRKGRGVLRDLLFDALFFAAVANFKPSFRSQRCDSAFLCERKRRYRRGAALRSEPRNHACRGARLVQVF